MTTIVGELRGIGMALRNLHNAVNPGTAPVDPRTVDLTAPPASSLPPPPPPPAKISKAASSGAGPSTPAPVEGEDDEEDTEEADISLSRRVGRAVKRIVTSPTKSPPHTSKGKKAA